MIEVICVRQSINRFEKNRRMLKGSQRSKTLSRAVTVTHWQLAQTFNEKPSTM